MSAVNWKIIDGEGKEAGPYSTSDLQGFYQSGHLNHDTLVWAEGMPEWVKAEAVPGLLPPRQTVVAPQLQQRSSGGINLAPEIPGVTPGSLAFREVKGWLCSLNLVSCLGALFLIFMPWLEMGCSEKSDRLVKGAMTEVAKRSIEERNEDIKEGGRAAPSEKVKKVKTDAKKSKEEEFLALYVQSGLDTVTGTVRISNEMDKISREINGTASSKALMNPVDRSAKTNAAVFIVPAISLIALSALLSVVVFVKRNRVVLITNQLLSLSAACCLALQMEEGFPLGDPEWALGSELSGGLAPERSSDTAFNEMFQIRYTVWLKLELGLLASTLVFLGFGICSRHTSKNRLTS